MVSLSALRGKPPIGTFVGSDRSAAQELLSQFAPRKQHQLQGQQGLDIFWLRSILNAFCCEKYKFGGMTTLLFTPMLAEISDKMPGVPAIWLLAFLLAATAIGCCRFSRWLYLFALPVAGWWAFGGYREFVADAYFRDAVMTELGRGYLIQAFCASWLPFVALLIHGVHDIRRGPNKVLHATAAPPAS